MGASKVYIVVRTDISLGDQVTQAVHGAQQFQDKHPRIYAEWKKTSNTVAILGAPNEAHLNQLQSMAESYSIPHAIFREPDIGDSLTVLVLAPHPISKRLTSSLSLLLP